MRRALQVLAVATALGWTAPAAALDRAGAIEAAKKEAGDKCKGATPTGGSSGS